jgi:AmpE protein
MKLLALIFAYMVSHYVSNPQKFRRFEWYESWIRWSSERLKGFNAELLTIIIVALPALLISLLALQFVDSIIGSLLISILILSYCIGPESLEEDVNSGEIRKRLGIRSNATISTLIKKMTQVAMRRWFAVFFWYVVLGIFGVLLYRLSERLDHYTKTNDNIKFSIAKLMAILNYPVAWMMVMLLAIASDFERIYKKCKPFLNIKTITSMDDSFLYEATDFAVENCEVEPESDSSIEQVSIRVLKRMLVVCMVFISILVIFAV